MCPKTFLYLLGPRKNIKNLINYDTLLELKTIYTIYKQLNS